MPAIMFSSNVMDEQTENNKQTNCFLKIFIRKPISLPLKAIHVTLTGSRRGSVPTSKIGRAHSKIKLISASDRAHFTNKIHKFPLNNVLSLSIMCKI